jgi:hypothetical protein
MHSKRAGKLSVCLLIVLITWGAAISLEPSTFGFYRLHGIAPATRKTKNDTITSARTIVPVKVYPGLCGPDHDEISLRVLFNHYGLPPGTMTRAIELNHNKKPKTQRDIDYHAQQLFKDGIILKIPLTASPHQGNKR